MSGSDTAAEALIQSLFDRAPTGVGLIDPDGRVRYSNPALRRFLGYSASELAELRVSDVLPQGEAPPGLSTGPQDSTDPPDRSPQETRFLRKDGRIVWGRLVRWPAPDSLAPRPSTLVMVQDITEQKAAGTSTDSFEQYYHALFDLSLHGVLLTKSDGTVLDANPTACRLLGMTAEEICARGRDALLVPGPEVEEGLRERREKGRVATEVSFVRKDGTTFRAELLSVLLPDESDIPRAFVVFGDISERERHQNALRESHDLLVKLAAQVPGAIYQFRQFPDGHACLPWASDAIRDVFEVTPEEVATSAAPIFDRLHPEDRDRVLRIIDESGRTLERFHVEYRVILPTKGLRWHLADSVPERMADGGTLWHGIILDITEQRRAEEALRESEERLRQAQKLEAIGRLAGGVAHDFNNLLTTIIGYSDFVLADPEFKRTPWYSDVGQIKMAAERASGLTRQILAFSRQQRLQSEIVSVNDLVREITPLLNRTLGEDVEVVTCLDPDVSPVEVDPAQFTQVLMNLAVNARDAMPNGGRLTFATANVWLDERSSLNDPDVAPGAYVRLAVSDTGVGIEPSAIPLLYEPFYTTKAPGSGTGLGLPTVYGIVKQSGGTIAVHSTPGKGTTFEVFLPRARERDLEPVPEGRARPAMTASTSRARERVLLLEDDEALRRLTERMLEKMGYEVQSVATGDEALAMLEGPDAQFALLVSDVVLPGTLDGGEVARRAKLIHKDLAVLFVSGYTRDVTLGTGQPGEGVIFLPKPFNAQQLAVKVREALLEVGKLPPDVQGSSCT